MTPKNIIPLFHFLRVALEAIQTIINQASSLSWTPGGALMEIASESPCEMTKLGGCSEETDEAVSECLSPKSWVIETKNHCCKGLQYAAANLELSKMPVVSRYNWNYYFGSGHFFLLSSFCIIRTLESGLIDNPAISQLSYNKIAGQEGNYNILRALTELYGKNCTLLHNNIIFAELYSNSITKNRDRNFHNIYNFSTSTNYLAHYEWKQGILHVANRDYNLCFL